MPHSCVWDFGVEYQWGASFFLQWLLSLRMVSLYSLRSPNFLQDGSLPSEKK